MTLDRIAQAKEVEVAKSKLATLLTLGLALSSTTITGCDSGSPLVQPTVGTLRVQITPDSVRAPWTVTVPGGTTRTGTGSATLTAMPAGAYTITYGNVDGWVTPAPDSEAGQLQVGATLTFAPTYTKVSVTTGTVVIDPTPDELQVPWTLNGPAGYQTSGQGDRTITELSAGTYMITWGDVDGYDTPSPDTGTLPESGTLTFARTYFNRNTPRGTLDVAITPAGLGAFWVLTDGTQGSTAIAYGAGDSIVTDIPVGNYQLFFGPVENYNSPSPNPVTVQIVADGTATVNAVYQAIQVAQGTVVVDANPDALNASWTLEGPDGFTAHGNGDAEFAGRAIGTYTVTWGAIADHDAPATQSGALTEGQTLTLAGTYTVQTGTVVIDVEPNAAGAPWTLVGPEGTRTGVGDRVIGNARVGNYTLTWGEVTGYATPFPAQRVVQLTAGETETIVGTYTPSGPAVGTVVVDPRPSEVTASWRLTGPDGFDRSGSAPATFSDVAIGAYTITWNAVPDWRTPVPAQSTQTLSTGATLEFIGVYGSLNGPSIQPVSGAVADGSSFTFSGTGFGGHTLQLSSGVGSNSWIENNPSGTDFNSLSGAPGWDVGLSSVAPFISNQRAWSGNQSALARVDYAANSYWQSSLRYHNAASFDRIYATFWVYWDPIDLSPHRSSQWKMWRINHNGKVSDQAGQIYFSSRHQVGGGISEHQWIAHCGLDCSGVAYDHCYLEAQPDPFYPARFNDPFQYRYLNRGDSVPWSDAHPQARQWNRVEIYIDRGQIDTFTGSLYYSIQRPGQGKVFEDRMTRVKMWKSGTCRNPQDPWQYFQMQNYWDDDGSNGAPYFGNDRADFFFDDIYLQFGTQARVEIGDSPVYDNCSRLEIQEPTNWSNSSITVKFNRGRFASGSTVYLFVVREDGSVSAGTPVTVQ